MFGDNTCGQLGLGFKPAASKPASVKGEYTNCNRYFDTNPLLSRNVTTSGY